MKRLTHALMFFMLIFTLAACSSEPSAEISNVEYTGMHVEFELSLTDRNDEVVDFLVTLENDDGEILESYGYEDLGDTHGAWEASFVTLLLAEGTYTLNVYFTYSYDGVSYEDELMTSESFEIEE